MERKHGADELLNTLGDFTSKENWDKFFSIRGSDDSFEWYAEWPCLRYPLISELSSFDAQTQDVAGTPSAATAASSLQILVPGCGNSRLSEHLYDAGFRGITNIDFSKVVISDMLRRNVRSRPDMRWRVMDMTQMQVNLSEDLLFSSLLPWTVYQCGESGFKFLDGSFDAVLDKGGLDALMEPELGTKLGSRYLSEVKRVLKSGGKFICLTLAESHVLGLLFSKFRFGWKANLHAIPLEQPSKCSFRTFMVVFEKEKSTNSYQIISSFDHSSLDCNENQSRGLFETLEEENKLRSECSNGVDVLYTLEDLQLGAKGDLKELLPGRRIQLTLGEVGNSHFSYKAVLLDAKQQYDPFLYHCGVFLVPKNRAHEWLFSSEEGQWVVVESSKSARLIMVLLDARHSNASMDDIQKDLSPLIKILAPRTQDNGAQIPFMMANDGVKQRHIVQQVTSTLTGPIVVEDVIYENGDGDGNGPIASKHSVFRRLTFQRSLGLVQSEALITRGHSQKIPAEAERKKVSSSKSRKKGSLRKNDCRMSLIDESRSNLKVDHNYLASSYHIGIISGFTLIASNLESAISSGKMVKAVIIGLGAGLLPMFLRACMPFLEIEVVELDPVISDLARDHFGFTEDKQLKVLIADGVEFVRKVAIGASSKVNADLENFDALSKERPTVPNGSPTKSPACGKSSRKIDILVVDADSSDSSSGITCPPADFVEESFLLSVKESLSEGGLFVINLVSRSPTIREMVVSRMKVVFGHLFSLQLEEDVNEVLFALPRETCIEENSLLKAAPQLEKLLKFTQTETGQNILDTARKITSLK